MMLRVRGKVERLEKIDPDIVLRNSVADNPTSTFHTTQNSWTIKRCG